jgi:hypothetical protein
MRVAFLAPLVKALLRLCHGSIAETTGRQPSVCGQPPRCERAWRERQQHACVLQLLQMLQVVRSACCRCCRFCSPLRPLLKRMRCRISLRGEQNLQHWDTKRPHFRDTLKCGLFCVAAFLSQQSISKAASKASVKPATLPFRSAGVAVFLAASFEWHACRAVPCDTCNTCNTCCRCCRHA